MTDFLPPDSSFGPPPSTTSLPLQYVSAGSTISHNPSGLLLGHGTLLVDGRMQATLSGPVERVNQLVTVRSPHSRYTGDIGDVVVGRVVDVQDTRWKVDVGSRQLATLLLASIHLPGGALRRRTAEDSLSMRTFFAPGDVLACEVQKVRGDGGLNLHTRSERYGRRGGGGLVQVQAGLIRRCKQHFQRVEGVEGVEICLGCNGWVWVGVMRPGMAGAMGYGDGEAEEDGSEAKQAKAEVEVTVEERERVVRVMSCLHVLNAQGLMVWNESIADVYAVSVEMGLPAKAMRNPDVRPVLAQAALARREAADAARAFTDEG